MSLTLNPELDIPIPPDVAYIDLRERIEACCSTVQYLQDNGLDYEFIEEDKLMAANLVAGYAANPESASTSVNHKQAAKIRPASLVLADSIMQEFGEVVVENAARIRHLVTNKLILLADSENNTTQLRALEMLGKISDVGLFAEKHDVTVTHKTSDELRDALRNKLTKIAQRVEGEEIEDAVIIDGEVLDPFKEMGLRDD